MSDLELEHVYSETITRIFIVVTDIGFAIAIAMFPFVMFVIFTQSTKPMSAYKWQTVYYMVSSYCMEFWFSVCKPVFLFPTPFAIFIGFTSTSTLSTNFNYLQFEVLYFFVIHMIFANYLSMAYRLIMIFGGYENTIFRKSKYFFIFASTMLIIPLSCIWIPLFFARLPEDEMYNVFAQEWPSLASNLANTTSLFGYSRNQLAYRFYIYSVFVILFSLLVTIVALELYMIPYLKKMKKIRSDSTFKLQVMIFKVLNIQTCLNFNLIILAGLWFSSSFIFGIKYGGPVNTAWYCASSCHPILDSWIILYYIKPYRVYIKKKFDLILDRLGLKRTDVVPIAPSFVSSVIERRS